MTYDIGIYSKTIGIEFFLSKVCIQKSITVFFIECYSNFCYRFYLYVFLIDNCRCSKYRLDYTVCFSVNA